MCACVCVRVVCARGCVCGHVSVLMRACVCVAVYACVLESHFNDAPGNGLSSALVSLHNTALVIW